MAWLLLAAAIGSEIVGTLMLRHVANSPTWWGITVVVVGYAASFSAMAAALRQLNVGVVYAVWSGVGTAAVAVAGVLLFGEHLTWRAVLGLVVIVLGVVVLVTSGSVRHGG